MVFVTMLIKDLIAYPTLECWARMDFLSVEIMFLFHSFKKELIEYPHINQV